MATPIGDAPSKRRKRNGGGPTTPPPPAPPRDPQRIPGRVTRRINTNPDPPPLPPPDRPAWETPTGPEPPADPVAFVEANAEEVLRLVMSGLSVRAIADRLNVPNHVIDQFVRRAGNRRMLADARRNMLDQVVRAATTVAVPMVTTLYECTTDTQARWSDRIAAAGIILKLLGIERLATVAEEGSAPMMAARERLDAKVDLMRERLAAIDTTATETAG